MPAPVFGVGDPVRGWGRLVRTRDGDWFDPPLPVPLVLRPGGRPVRRPSGLAIPVEGADFDAVGQRYERDGAVEGYATVRGRWLGERIRVHHQTGERPERPGPRRSDPPCEPPPGGWPHGPMGHHISTAAEEVDLGDLQETGAAVSVAIFRPSGNQAVLVVAAADIAAVEAWLRPQVADRLCVVASRWTRRQVDAAHAHLRAMGRQWGIWESGESCDERGQAVVTAQLVRVTHEVARWSDAQPAGLVVLEPCLVGTTVAP